MSVRLVSLNHWRTPGVLGIMWLMIGSLKTVNHSSVIAGMSSIVAGSRSRAILGAIVVQLLCCVDVGCCKE